ncbi:SDR family NAD(P)-dependent oxidoreductase [Microbacterium horticulturae]|uniref:SDR family NAD(P)-dependent oxidoreductase n=1 Tax=Microbacterium horticulturae TaxID=3028316 RepID=A0ABY8BY03_9MICO|nr:SDR family NAD(P)-dependent oxidoreductase [Microbacterium sp. KACC 23027]WEG07726.1 SDR family NAD(P)-dependent oxidoreductase [Microbacterium sp. KACC 23027]
MVTALVTGASSGLGAEYARQLADRGADLVLVGRDAAALDAVATQVRERGREAEVLVADLLDAEALAAVIARVVDAQHPVEILVDNAGFGMSLAFERNDVEAEVRHLRLHDEIPLRLMHAALGPMLERGHGRILNVASIAAFMPRSTYGAVKQWLVSFTRWANVTYGPRGVTVTAVCPGFVHTNFHERLGLQPGQEGIAGWMWLDAATVVRESLRDLARGRAVSVPSLRYKLIRRLLPLLPDRLVAGLGQRGR